MQPDGRTPVHCSYRVGAFIYGSSIGVVQRLPSPVVRMNWMLPPSPYVRAGRWRAIRLFTYGRRFGRSRNRRGNGLEANMQFQSSTLHGRDLRNYASPRKRWPQCAANVKPARPPGAAELARRNANRETSPPSSCRGERAREFDDSRARSPLLPTEVLLQDKALRRRIRRAAGSPTCGVSSRGEQLDCHDQDARDH